MRLYSLVATTGNADQYGRYLAVVWHPDTPTFHIHHLTDGCIDSIPIDVFTEYGGEKGQAPTITQAAVIMDRWIANRQVFE